MCWCPVPLLSGGTWVFLARTKSCGTPKSRRPRKSTVSSEFMLPSSFAEAFDEQHGCNAQLMEADETESGQDFCATWDPDELPKALERGRIYCWHALCLGRMLNANDVHLDEREFVRAQSALWRTSISRSGSAEPSSSWRYVRSWQLRTSEGASCLSIAANRTESHDIAIRWMGVEAMNRLLTLGDETTAAGTFRYGTVGWIWDQFGSPGSSLGIGWALYEMESRLEHWQPGTRWMVLHGVGTFAPVALRSPNSASSASGGDGVTDEDGKEGKGDTDGEGVDEDEDEDEDAHARSSSVDRLIGIVESVLLSLRGDMGFPGIGLLAAETLPRLFAGGTHVDRVLTALARQLDTKEEDVSGRGTTATLVRLLVIEATRQISASSDAVTLHSPEAARELTQLVAESRRSEVRVAALLTLASSGVELPAASRRILIESFGSHELMQQSDGAEERCALLKALVSLRTSAPIEGDDQGSVHTMAAHTSQHAACGDQAARDECKDWSCHAAAYLRIRDGGADGAFNEASEMRRLVTEPERTLGLLAVAPKSKGAALLCMHYLASQPADRASSDGSGLSHQFGAHRQRLRWRALLTLPLVLPIADANSTAAVRALALQLLQRDEDVMDRYAGMKALALVAERGDNGAITALGHALRDWVDVIKLQAGEHLVALAVGAPAHALEVLLRQLQYDDPYTRFAAAVALRKLAAMPAVCGAAAQRAEQLVLVTVFGQLHTGAPEALLRVANATRAAFESNCFLRTTGPAATSRVHAEADGTVVPQERVRPTIAAASNEVTDAAGGEGTHASVASRARMRRGVVGSAHCFSQLRALPAAVFERALNEFRLQHRQCNDSVLSDPSGARARGVLLVRQAVSTAEAATNLAYLRELRSNTSERAAPVKRYHGRSTFRGGKMNNPQDIHRVNPQLLSTLDGLLADWNARGMTPQLPHQPSYRWGSHELQVREIEHVVLNPDDHDCPFIDDVLKIPCGCDWHVDGGMRGYKMWVPLEKKARSHTNIVLAPMNHAAQLCDLAGRLNASHTKANGEEDAAAEARALDTKPTWQMADDSKGSTHGWVLEDPLEFRAKERRCCTGGDWLHGRSRSRRHALLLPGYLPPHARCRGA